MATGVIAVLGASLSATYTPSTDAKVVIDTSTTLTINGVAAALPAGPASIIYVGAGQTLTVATSVSQACVISALES